jgi:hypothetical protein
MRKAALVGGVTFIGIVVGVGLLCSRSSADG